MINGQQTGPWTDWQSIQVKDSSPAPSEPTQPPASKPAQSQELATVAALTPPLAVNEHPRLTQEECQKHWIDARRPGGYTHNRYSWCVIGDWNIDQVIGRTIVPHFKSTMMFIGYTFNGVGSLRNQPGEATSRNIIIDLHAKVDQVLPRSAGQSLKIGAMPDEKYCEHVTKWNGVDHHNNILKKFGEWQTGDTYRFHLRCPAAKADAKRTVTWNESDQNRETLQNAERASLGKITLYGDFSDLPVTRGKIVANLGDGQREQWVQCDNAVYLSNTRDSNGDTQGTGGCVFDSVVPSLQHELGKDYDAAYIHYWLACYRPNDTYPPILKPVADRYPAIKGKSIPGCLDPSKDMRYNYLHRIDRATARNNRNTITGRACAWLWPNDTGEASGNQCDEFPFATTWERWNNKYPGAFLSGAGYSLCPIPEEENENAGSLNGAFVGKERILIGDPYYIKFKDEPPNPTKCVAPVPGRHAA
jgi:hypothetical protein